MTELAIIIICFSGAICGWTSDSLKQAILHGFLLTLCVVAGALLVYGGNNP